MKKRELLFSVTKKDLVIDWFSGSGGGGQHRNKHQNCCRMKHPDSGAQVTAQEQRSRVQNQAVALRRLVKHPKFRFWHAQKVAEILKGKTVEEEVDKTLVPENLRVEIKEGGKWVEMISEKRER